jgi:hypothetical protein
MNYEWRKAFLLCHCGQSEAAIRNPLIDTLPFPRGLRVKPAMTTVETLCATHNS